MLFAGSAVMSSAEMKSGRPPGCARCVLNRNRLKESAEQLRSANETIKELRTERNALVKHLDVLSQSVAERADKFQTDLAAVRLKFLQMTDGNTKTLVAVQKILFEIQSAVKDRENPAVGENRKLSPSQSFWAAGNPSGPHVPDLSKVVAKLTRENLRIEANLDDCQQQLADMRSKLKSSRKLVEGQDAEIEELKTKLNETESFRQQHGDLKRRYRQKKQSVAVLQTQLNVTQKKMKNLTQAAVDKEISLQQITADLRNKDRLIHLLKAADNSDHRSFGVSPKSLGSTPINSGSTGDGGLVVDVTMADDSFNRATFSQAMEMLSTPIDAREKRFLRAIEETKQLRAERDGMVERLDSLETQMALMSQKLTSTEAQLDEAQSQTIAMHSELNEASEKLKSLDQIGGSTLACANCLDRKRQSDEAERNAEQLEKMRQLLATAAETLEDNQRQITRLNEYNSGLVAQVNDTIRGLQEKTREVQVLSSRMTAALGDSQQKSMEIAQLREFNQGLKRNLDEKSLTLAQMGVGPRGPLQPPRMPYYQPPYNYGGGWQQHNGGGFH